MWIEYQCETKQKRKTVPFFVYQYHNVSWSSLFDNNSLSYTFTCKHGIRKELQIFIFHFFRTRSRSLCFLFLCFTFLFGFSAVKRHDAACGKSHFASLNFVVLIQHFNFFSLQSAQRTYICICFTVRICTIFVIIYPANFSQLCRLRNDLYGAARLFRMITLIVCCQRGFYAKCIESSRFSVCFYYHYYYYSLNTHEK